MDQKSINRWWPLALSSELDGSIPLARLCAGREYVLFRDGRGVARILEDQCAHRRAPLSLGRITPQGWLQCPYHGWCFEGKGGECKQIPNLGKGETIPGQYRVGHFVSAERNGMIFLWSGDPLEADESVLPDFSVSPAKKTAHSGGEGLCLITLPQQHFIATLLDGPSLVINASQVTVIDDHMLGEPLFSANHLLVERVADWTEKARRRRRVPSDYPLILRTTLHSETDMALLEWRDAATNTPLLSALVASMPVTDCVTAVRWQWSRHSLSNKQLSLVPHRAFERLQFAVNGTLDAAALTKLHPYVSSIRSGQLDTLAADIIPAARL